MRQFWILDGETEVPETAPHLKVYVLTTQRACSIYVLNDPVSHFIPLKFASKKGKRRGSFVGKRWLCNMLRPSASSGGCSPLLPVSEVVLEPLCTSPWPLLKSALVRDHVTNDSNLG